MAIGGLERRLGADVEGCELITGLKPPIKGPFQSDALVSGGLDKEMFPNVGSGFWPEGWLAKGFGGGWGGLSSFWWRNFILCKLILFQNSTHVFKRDLELAQEALRQLYCLFFHKIRCHDANIRLRMLRKGTQCHKMAAFTRSDCWFLLLVRTRRKNKSRPVNWST